MVFFYEEDEAREVRGLLYAAETLISVGSRKTQSQHKSSAMWFQDMRTLLFHFQLKHRAFVCVCLSAGEQHA
jgi:hypothetical protein